MNVSGYVIVLLFHFWTLSISVLSILFPPIVLDIMYDANNVSYKNQEHKMILLLKTTVREESDL